MSEAHAVSWSRKVLLPAELKARWPPSVQLPNYTDAVWDLSPLLPPSTRRTMAIVRFTSCEDPEVSAALRDFLHIRLNYAAPPHRQQLLPLHLSGVFYLARRCFRFVKDELGTLNVSQIEQPHLDRFLRQLIEEGRSPISISNHVVVWQDLHLFRTKLATGGLSFFPWGGRAATAVAGGPRRPKENRTERIPEHIVQNLLFWALRYVEEFSSDILAAREELSRAECASRAMLAADMRLSLQSRADVRRDRISGFIDDRRAAGRGLPVCTADDGRNHIGRGRPNYAMLSLLLGDPDRTWLSNCRTTSLFDAALKELGPEEGGLNVVCGFSESLGRRWKSGFNQAAVLRESRLLQTACYVVCAYLTGMRDSEVQSMRRGCLSSVRSEDGVIERYVITAEKAKGRSHERPLAEWVAIEPVASAVRVLECLQKEGGEGKLWEIIDGLKVKGGYQTISYGINRYLKIFALHLEQEFGVDLREAGGQRWRFRSRQFRRTMAWHIARRPFGVVAGKIQYQHASVAAFEGYAGTSASGFRDEVEEELAIAQLEGLLEYRSDRLNGQPLSGPGAPRVEAMLAELDSTLGDLPGLIADSSRIRSLLKTPARTLFIGLLSDCFFKEETALCLKGTRSGTRRPVAALCAPTRCANSCISRRHLAAWRGAAAHALDALKVRGLSRAQREAIREDLHRIDTVLSELEPK